jgi:TatA/E family protein of Tat protein translocase
MEIFGIGPMELILILIIALMVFGPDKLPEIGAKLGKGLRSMREATREFSKEIEETRAALEAPIKEVTDPLREVTQAAHAISNPGAALRSAVIGEVNAADAAARVTSTPTNGAATNGAATDGAVTTGAATTAAVAAATVVTQAAATGTANSNPPTWAPPSAADDGEITLAPLPYVPAEDALPTADNTGSQGLTADQFFPRPAAQDTAAAAAPAAASDEPTMPQTAVEEPEPALIVPVDGRNAGGVAEAGEAFGDGTEDVPAADYFPEAEEAPASRAALTRPQPVAAQPAAAVPAAREPAAAKEPAVVETTAAPDAPSRPPAAAQSAVNDTEDSQPPSTQPVEAAAAPVEETPADAAATSPAASAESESIDLPALPAPEE